MIPVHPFCNLHNKTKRKEKEIVADPENQDIKIGKWEENNN